MDRATKSTRGSSAAANLATLERLLGTPPLAITGWTPERSAFGNAVLDVSGAVRLRESLLAAVRR